LEPETGDGFRLDGELGHGRSSAPTPRQRERHIPAAVRRAVFGRDEGRCSYVEAGARRCAETRWLEFHHLKPFAIGGDPTLSNIALRCRAHNALAAEADFGRAFVMAQRGSEEHEPFCRQSDTR
jgi:hypothetical protein